MCSRLKKFIRNHVATTLVAVFLLIGTAWAANYSLTYGTWAIIDTLLLAVDSDADGSIIDETWFTNFLLVGDIDNVAVEDEMSAPISSGWAFTHTNASDQHPEYLPDHQIFAAFTASDATPDVSGGQYFQTSDTTTITGLDDGGDSSTLTDGQMVKIMALHAGGFDFTSSGLFSPYGQDVTMTVGAIYNFTYDLENALWRWENTTYPTAAPSGEADGFLVITGPGAAALRLISGTASEITVDDPDGSEGNITVSLPASIDLGGKTLEIPNQAASDVALTALGQIAIDDTDDSVAWHDGANGEVAGEVQISAIYHKTWSFDPDAICDGAVDRLFLMSIGDEAPNGIIIDEWKVSFEADPTTEADLDLKYADAFIGVANAAVIDVLDTTTGASSEDTDVNINGGAAVANGKAMYLEFGTAYTETTHQVIFELWYHLEED